MFIVPSVGICGGDWGQVGGNGGNGKRIVPERPFHVGLEGRSIALAERHSLQFSIEFTSRPSISSSSHRSTRFGNPWHCQPAGTSSSSPSREAAVQWNVSRSPLSNQCVAGSRLAFVSGRFGLALLGRNCRRAFDAAEVASSGAAEDGAIDPAHAAATPVSLHHCDSRPHPTRIRPTNLTRDNKRSQRQRAKIGSRTLPRRSRCI